MAPHARYNLTSSGLFEPDLSAMGVNTSYDDFASEKDEHERLFTEAVAELYGAKPDNVVVTSGASEAIFIVYSVLGNGRTAVVPKPNYGPMFTVPRTLGMQVRQTLSHDARPGGTVFGLTDPNNPTGRLLEGDSVGLISKSSRKTGAIVFVNETYKGFAFRRTPGSFFGFGDGVVTCSTMTKFFGLGRLRAGWILAEREKAQKMLRAKRMISGHNSEYSLWIARQVLKKRANFEKRAKQTCSENAVLVSKFIDETAGVSGELGVTPFCLIKYEKGPDSVTLARRLFKSTGVLVSPGDFFGAPKAFRLCFTPDKAVLAPALHKLSDFLAEKPGRR